MDSLYQLVDDARVWAPEQIDATTTTTTNNNNRAKMQIHKQINRFYQKHSETMHVSNLSCGFKIDCQYN